MFNTDINSIDWEALWKRHSSRSGPQTGTAAGDWDRQAAEFERQFSRSDYSRNLLSKIEIQPEYTILDVGCGPGTIAIPLASRVKSITALDMSQEMVRIGAEKAQRLGINNINFLKQDWEDVVIGKNLQPHDIVICSRSFPSRNPKETLLKLNRAAKKFVYLTLRTAGDGAETFYRNIYSMLGKEYSAPADYIYCYNLLYRTGIRANVNFITYTDCFRYADSEEAYQILNTHIRVENDDQREKLRLYIRQNMQENGEFKLDIGSRWALVWWPVTAEGENKE